MAERFINNLHVGQSFDKRELEQFGLWKKQASLKEMLPVFAYLEVGAVVNAQNPIPNQVPLVLELGVDHKISIRDIFRLNDTNGDNL